MCFDQVISFPGIYLKEVIRQMHKATCIRGFVNSIIGKKKKKKSVIVQ